MPTLLPLLVSLYLDNMVRLASPSIMAVVPNQRTSSSAYFYFPRGGTHILQRAGQGSDWRRAPFFVQGQAVRHVSEFLLERSDHPLP